MKQDQVITYMEYEWVQVDDQILTIGINEDGLDQIERILKLELPPENEEVLADEICGELETDDGSLNIYSPVKGVVTEVNAAVLENPSLLLEDPFGEGWLIRLEAEDNEEIEEFVRGSSGEGAADEEDEEDDEDDEDEDEEEDEEDY